MRIVRCDNVNCDAEANLDDLENQFFIPGAGGSGWMQYDDIHLCPDCSAKYSEGMQEVKDLWQKKRKEVLANIVGVKASEVEVPEDAQNVVPLFGELNNDETEPDS